MKAGMWFSAGNQPPAIQAPQPAHALACLLPAILLLPAGGRGEGLFFLSSFSFFYLSCSAEGTVQGLFMVFRVLGFGRG